MAKILISPSKYLQGAGEMKKIGTYASNCGKKALVLISKGGYKRIGKMIEDSFAENTCEVVFDYFNGECCNSEIDRLVNIVKENQCDLVIGIGVVMFALAILPSLGKTKMTLYSVELSTLAKDNYRFQTRKIVYILLFVYVGMTAMATVMLRIAGMDWFDAVNHAFSAISTGGFSTKNASIAYFDNLWIELVIVFFTFVSGLHFGLIYSTLTGSRNNLFRSEVTRYYFLCAVTGVFLITLSLWLSGTYGSFATALRYGLFQGVTVLTTTGFATADTNLWTPLAMTVLFFFTLQCACAGSTAGGIKCDRILLSFKVLRNRIRQQQHPNAVLRIKLNGVTQEESTINFAMLYIAVYFLFIILGTLINTACGVDFITSLTASATCMGNVGPGFGEVGSMESFAAMPGVMKFSSTALMLFGRLEIFGLIQLFMIKWWV